MPILPLFRCLCLLLLMILIVRSLTRQAATGSLLLRRGMCSDRGKMRFLGVLWFGLKERFQDMLLTCGSQTLIGSQQSRDCSPGASSLLRFALFVLRLSSPGIISLSPATTLQKFGCRSSQELIQIKLCSSLGLSSYLGFVPPLRLLQHS